MAVSNAVHRTPRKKSRPALVSPSISPETSVPSSPHLLNVELPHYITICVVMAAKTNISHMTAAQHYHESQQPSYLEIYIGAEPLESWLIFIQIPARCFIMIPIPVADLMAILILSK